MLSEAEFKRTMRAFEASFTKCLDTLLTLKAGEAGGEKSKAEDLQRFQARLYDALLKLSREYHRLRIRRESLISSKSSLSAAWFKRRQRTLAERQKALQRAIRAGRNLGDAFIWFFYRNDPELLNQHIAQPAPSLPPAGIGGEGELALVDGVRMLGDKYILFHGISSLFRLGDASLFDFKRQRIVGMGELKTVKVEENRFNLQFVASLNRNAGSDFTAAHPTKPVGSRQRLTPKQDNQLKRQLAKISTAATTAERPFAKRLELTLANMGHVRELNALVPQATVGRFASHQVSPGLLLIAYGQRQRSLTSKLIGQRRPISSTAMSALPEKVKQLALPGSPYNCIILSSVFYGPDWEPTLMPGATPFLWWPLDRPVLRDMALANREVVTVYNPAHLLTKLEKKGFVVARFKPPNDFALTFQDGDTKLTLENCGYFLRLVTTSLLSEDYVVELVLRSTTQLRGVTGNPTRVDLQFVHQML